MIEQNSAIVLGALDQTIERYIEARRMNLDVFIKKHFSVQETLQIQKKSFSIDLVFIPLNTLWSIPYLSIKKIIEILDKLGLARLSTVLEWLPSGIKTGYQKEIERLIANELLDCDSLIKEVAADPILKKTFADDQIVSAAANARKSIIREIEKYSSSQAMVSDLSSSLMTLCLGGMLFGDKTLGVLGLGNKIAHKMAVNKAASGFFLGKSLGASFYNAFPPEPSRMQVFLATLGVGFFLAVVSLITSVMSDPLRKGLGLHKRKLSVLIDSLEESLFLHFRKEIKKSQKELLNQPKLS